MKDWKDGKSRPAAFSKETRTICQRPAYCRQGPETRDVCVSGGRALPLTSFETVAVRRSYWGGEEKRTAIVHGTEGGMTRGDPPKQDQNRRGQLQRRAQARATTPMVRNFTCPCPASSAGHSWVKAWLQLTGDLGCSFAGRPPRGSVQTRIRHRTSCRAPKQQDPDGNTGGVAVTALQTLSTNSNMSRDNRGEEKNKKIVEAHFLFKTGARASETFREHTLGLQIMCPDHIPDRRFCRNTVTGSKCKTGPLWQGLMNTLSCS
ncbi:hypothetical protein B0T24DRAFT_96487 [Lasiosphaeria ovina]|uniref:Uncharacterized protein n=1 Tax=Lasiosphaeria ovina TaxID=92902 RepID=A0AAE0JU52_9PEZI|nr:hypothetical protein B0T24DRAFT_96487 [Lasiosphaeria ovina]